MNYGKFIRGIFVGSREMKKRDGTFVYDISLAAGVDAYKLRCRDSVVDSALGLKFGQAVECMVSQWRSQDGQLVIDYADTLTIINNG